MESNSGNRMERKKEETRKKITLVAMDLFKKQGFDSTTMEQIANEADIAKGTLYNHFPVKEAILAEYVQRETKELMPRALRLLQELPDTRSRLITLLRKGVEWMEQYLNNDIYEKYFIYRMQTVVQAIKNPGLRSGFNTVLEQFIRMGQEAGEIRQDVPVKVLSNQLEAIHVFTVIDWVTKTECSSIYESIERNVDLFLDGAKNRGN